MSGPQGNVTNVSDPEVAEVLVRARGLTKRFGVFTAVNGIDFSIPFSIPRGEAFGFLGPNGAGKSSTMRMIGCVSPPTSGELTTSLARRSTLEDVFLRLTGRHLDDCDHRRQAHGQVGDHVDDGEHAGALVRDRASGITERIAP